MSVVSHAASHILESLWGFGIPVAYAAYRGLLLPRAFEHSNDPPPSLLDDATPERPDAVRAGTLVFAVIAIMGLLFFLNVAGSDIWIVMRGRPGWGVLTGLLGLGLVAEAATIEWLHQQDNRYTDLLSDADEGASRDRAKSYQRSSRLARIGMFCWGALFVVAIVWLLLISRAE